MTDSVPQTEPNGNQAKERTMIERVNFALTCPICQKNLEGEQIVKVSTPTPFVTFFYTESDHQLCYEGVRFADVTCIDELDDLDDVRWCDTCKKLAYPLVSHWSNGDNDPLNATEVDYTCPTCSDFMFSQSELDIKPKEESC